MNFFSDSNVEMKDLTDKEKNIQDSLIVVLSKKHPHYPYGNVLKSEITEYKGVRKVCIVWDNKGEADYTMLTLGEWLDEIERNVVDNDKFTRDTFELEGWEIITFEKINVVKASMFLPEPTFYKNALRERIEEYLNAKFSMIKGWYVNIGFGFSKHRKQYHTGEIWLSQKEHIQTILDALEPQLEFWIMQQ